MQILDSDLQLLVCTQAMSAHAQPICEPHELTDTSELEASSMVGGVVQHSQKGQSTTAAA